MQTWLRVLHGRSKSSGEALRMELYSILDLVMYSGGCEGKRAGAGDWGGIATVRGGRQAGSSSWGGCGASVSGAGAGSGGAVLVLVVQGRSSDVSRTEMPRVEVLVEVQRGGPRKGGGAVKASRRTRRRRRRNWPAQRKQRFSNLDEREFDGRPASQKYLLKRRAVAGSGRAKAAG